jgi:hypothetical protein
VRNLTQAADEGRAARAVVEMGAQVRPLELRELAIECERRARPRALAVLGQDRFHKEYDAAQRDRLESYPLSASAPATISRISWVICAWRARFIASVSRSISSPAFFEALRIAVICAARNDAADSSSAR